MDELQRTISLSADKLRNKIYLTIQSDAVRSGTVAIYNMSGQLSGKQSLRVMKGKNTVEILNPGFPKDEPKVITVYLDNQSPISEKIIF